MDIDYVIKKSDRRSISVTVGSDGKLLIKAPLGVSVQEVESFLYEKKSWIINRIQKTQKQNELARQMGPLSQEDIVQIKKKARQIIPQRVEHYSRLAGIDYNRIFIRLQKSRWGSCSADGNLNFNCLLVLMPLEILDSVVVHELCHRHHMDHSKAFYAEVYKLFPDYRRCDRWLKENGGIYFKRIENYEDS
ncbi:SprT family zinc-dependent metalloprotease [Treponema sp.]|uniref:M48 family metallopeptidase n=1 Tax=Treponema sp. TaxID=166 RepID=UPI00298DC9A5|nr:SprT family zinc-dependent metalloprotease [Treponema sp.]MCQ2242327.1 M48 family metallopeptidase [Treponema sp.]